MKTLFTMIVTLLISFLFSNCSAENTVIKNTDTIPNSQKNIRYLALGDSYTIGESVCENCKFPEQLKKALQENQSSNKFSLNIIARTGWTTTNLINAINQEKPTSEYDLVTLLIGVNNQYQGIPFPVYEKEFPELVSKSIAFAKGNKERLIVVSIPDYAFTPFGQSSRKAETITIEINKYNAFAKKHCEENGIAFINITDITRNGLKDSKLVASDGLHPSEKGYTLFVERLLPKVSPILEKK
ncbi:SGNH/GDSL hydrolase family protein [Flavobacterium sp.]|uniref:SGNH/GDSL hydrolase family protein n=1 Tax=Flavobacterium sp. TaxID=239 RepID=UPI003C5BEA27